MPDNKNDFTQGNIVTKLLKFMIPILGALILQAMYGAVDISGTVWNNSRHFRSIDRKQYS